VRKHFSVGAKAGERPGDDTLTDYIVSSSLGRRGGLEHGQTDILFHGTGAFLAWRLPLFRCSRKHHDQERACAVPPAFSRLKIELQAVLAGSRNWLLFWGSTLAPQLPPFPVSAASKAPTQTPIPQWVPGAFAARGGRIARC